MIVTVCTVLAASLLLYAAMHDVVARTVPNWTSGAIVVAAMPLRLMESNLIGAAEFGAGVFVLLSLLWRFHVLGGGDVKLWAASTMLLHPLWRVEINSFNLVLLIGGGLAIMYLILRSLYGHEKSSPCFLGRRLWQRAIRAEFWRMRRGGSLPYAVAIASGVVITLWTPR